MNNGEKGPGESGEPSPKKKSTICFITYPSKKRRPRKDYDDESLEPEKILGATDDPELLFVIKFKNVEKPSVVPAREANIKWPQLVIGFYEDHLHLQEFV